MGHALVYVLLPEDPGATGKHPDSVVIDRLMPYADMGMSDDTEAYRLSEPAPPDDDGYMSANWRMTPRQCRLELDARLQEAGIPNDMTAETPLERLAELANRTREYHGESYRVENGMIVAVSTVQPFPKYDWYEIGGRWSSEFAPPEVVKRTEREVTCSLCEGSGRLVEKTGFLSSLFGRKPDPSDGAPCPRCKATGTVTEVTESGEARDEDLILSPKDAIRIMDAEDIGGPWAIVDLDGVWHGGEGGMLWGLPEEDDAEAAIKDIARDILRRAPVGTVVVPVDIHM
ncbi:hypothetical protein [Minwuia thermotolerans]|uniref:Uncharacterized protein n=1 Tax=Minwuia thermotolerans TaxID=2056226 RepID=A0A2M9FXP7_9PROT|nr:hypothetical protein [Minwuia thermotolerans]PJK28238.1 hypothetical protein CVT23_17855 [Minwuia thermotolerans]